MTGTMCVSYKLLLFGHRNLIRNTTQTAVINIFKIRILLNLTFRMFVHIHFQKYNSYGFWEAIYTDNFSFMLNIVSFYV